MKFKVTGLALTSILRNGDSPFIINIPEYLILEGEPIHTEPAEEKKCICEKFNNFEIAEWSCSIHGMKRKPEPKPRIEKIYFGSHMAVKLKINEIIDVLNALHTKPQE